MSLIGWFARVPGFFVVPYSILFSKKPMELGATERRLVPDIVANVNKTLFSHAASCDDKPLFIDMGSNIGQGFEYFSQFYSPDCFDFWFLEPNPHLTHKLSQRISSLYVQNQWKGKGQLLVEAVSNANGFTKFYGLVEDSRGLESDGASIVRNHNSIWYKSNPHKAIDIKIVRATDLIKRALENNYKTIVVKMDIEGAEYDVLEDLIKSGFIEKISHLYVEFHSQFVREEERGAVLLREKTIKETLKGYLFAWI